MTKRPTHDIQNSERWLKPILIDIFADSNTDPTWRSACLDALKRVAQRYEYSDENFFTNEEIEFLRGRVSTEENVQIRIELIELLSFVYKPPFADITLINDLCLSVEPWDFRNKEKVIILWNLKDRCKVSWGQVAEIFRERLTDDEAESLFSQCKPLDWDKADIDELGEFGLLLLRNARIEERKFFFSQVLTVLHPSWQKGLGTEVFSDYCNSLPYITEWCSDLTKDGRDRYIQRGVLSQEECELLLSFSYKAEPHSNDIETWVQTDEFEELRKTTYEALFGKEDVFEVILRLPEMPKAE